MPRSQWKGKEKRKCGGKETNKENDNHNNTLGSKHPDSFLSHCMWRSEERVLDGQETRKSARKGGGSRTLVMTRRDGNGVDRDKVRGRKKTWEMVIRSNVV